MCANPLDAPAPSTTAILAGLDPGWTASFGAHEAMRTRISSVQVAKDLIEIHMIHIINVRGMFYLFDLYFLKLKCFPLFHRNPLPCMVYLRRLQMCRDLFFFALEDKEKK